MKKIALVCALTFALSVSADMMDRPGGIRIGQRFLLRPYVSLSYTYDSNHDSSAVRNGTHSFQVNPGFNLVYRGDQFELTAAAWYQYYAYTENSESLNNHSFGETLSFHWHDGATAQSDAWDFLLTESYSRISQNDDMMNDGGRGIGRDRDQLDVNAVLMRNFTEKFHASVYGGFYWLNYLNDSQSYAAMYGWSRWTAGGDIGYRLSRWSDFFITGNYQGYLQDNSKDLDAATDPTPKSGKTYGDRSDGFTLQGGVGSAFTERISYRVSGGWSYFRYGGSDSVNGFCYDVSGRWKMTDTWNMMLLAGSYYQPSERDYGAVTRNDTISWGLAHSMVRGKLVGTFDLAYRNESHPYCDYEGDDYTAHILTARLGLDYTLCRFIAIFGHAEYQTEFDRGGDSNDGDWDYNRWRLTVGMRFQY